MIASTLLLSCGSNEIPSDMDDTDTPTAKKNKKGNKFGDWEQDNQGNKYREDYELKEMLGGYELVKYTRINGGQFGGGSSTTKFTLCSDGSMKYYHQSQTTVSVDGAGGSDASEDDDYGTWKAVETGDGYKLLMIQSTKYETTGFMELKLMGSKIQMVRNNEWQEFFMKKTDC
jgi:hypothetical protein